MANRPIAAIAAAGLVLLSANWVRAADDDLSSAFSGRFIDFVIGVGPSGQQDRYARVIGRHLVRHIPGRPSVVYRNMPGASGRKAAEWLAAAAPRNGLAIAAITASAIMMPLVGDGAKGRYDPLALRYLGSAATPVYVCIAHREAPVTRFDDALRHRLVVGATARGGATRDIAHALRNLVGARFRMVDAYRDHAQLLRALQFGEVQGACGYDWATLKVQRPDLVKDGNVRVLLQIAMEGRTDLNAKGVPVVWKFVRGKAERKALELLASAQRLGRPYAAPPQVPRPRLTALRTAFERTMKDLDFRLDARRAGLEISPTYGEDMQRAIEKLYRTPKPIVEKARAARRG